MKLVPTQDNIILKQVDAEKTTASGIVLPDSAKEKPVMAEVIAVGPGYTAEGKEVKMDVKPGDRVLYTQYAGTKAKLDGVEYIIVSMGDIKAIVEE